LLRSGAPGDRDVVGFTSANCRCVRRTVVAFDESLLRSGCELIKVCIKPETIEKISISPHPCK